MNRYGERDLLVGYLVKIWVAFMDLGKEPVIKNSCISLVISFPNDSQLEWKKLAEKPSGPGALSGWIEKNCCSKLCFRRNLDQIHIGLLRHSRGYTLVYRFSPASILRA